MNKNVTLMCRRLKGLHLSWKVCAVLVDDLRRYTFPHLLCGRYEFLLCHWAKLADSRVQLLPNPFIVLSISAQAVIFLLAKLFLARVRRLLLSFAFLACFRAPFFIIEVRVAVVVRSFLANKTREQRRTRDRRCQFRSPNAKRTVFSFFSIFSRVTSMLCYLPPKNTKVKSA